MSGFPRLTMPRLTMPRLTMPRDDELDESARIIEGILRDLAKVERAKRAELPAPPPGFYWHREQRFEDEPDRDAVRLVVTWDLRAVEP